ncbi:CHASE2 domain-containing protein [uncultured Endozoicomonas sp.]|uniref:CHASE2 domain-containing protein n=1 Tax=uncultured Endozoicomonas sp. TaxID=432652 RepID=UPI0026116F82|nr:CHASE2 domain-containing protein [uncultured Endozoicomonas sp.]
MNLRLISTFKVAFTHLKIWYATLTKKHPASFFVASQLLFATFIFVLNPFGLKDYTDQYSERLLSQFMAPFYQNTGQSDITVVLINDAALKDLELTWPISYQEYAKILRRILSYEPKAVFVDILYSQNRGQKGLTNLKRILQMHNDPDGQSPIFIADVVNDQGSMALPELQSGVLSAPVNWSHYAEQYPLQLERNNNIRETPATELFRVFCKRKDCGDLQWLNEAPPLTISWGTRVDPIMQYVTGDSQNCQTHEQGFAGSLIAGWNIMRQHALFGLNESQEFDQKVRQTCPYSRQLFVNQLGSRNDTTEALLHDKLVFLGGIFHGIPDYVNSPIHGQLPGVFFHAMALDNLLTQGEHYLRAPDAVFSFSSFDWADLIELIIMTLILVIIARHNFHAPSQSSWLASFIGIIVINILGALFMSLYLRYPAVNALGIVLLTGLALAVSQSDSESHSTPLTHGENDNVN